MRIRPLRAILPIPEYIASTDSFFSTVKEDYNEYLDNGFFEQDLQGAIYVYQIRTPERSYTGLITKTDVEDYLDGNIKKHEHTLPPKEQRQLQLLLKRKAMVKPILLAYPDVFDLNQFINSVIEQEEPSLTIFLDDDHRHHLIWEIKDDRRIGWLQKQFAEQVPEAYIADGHHRCATTARLFMQAKKRGEETAYSQLLCAFFPASELEILDFNRVIDCLADCSPTYLMARFSQLFDIDPLSVARKPEEKHELTLFINQEWYLLRWKAVILAAQSDQEVLFDASLLDELVMRDILGIQDVRTDSRVEYVEGPKGLEGLRKKALKSDTRIGFCLFPVQLDEMFTVARAGRVLPPKSTWFEPRLKNGIIVQDYRKTPPPS